MTNPKRDAELGMHRPISRRDFLNGFSLAVGGSFLLPSDIWSETFGVPTSAFGAIDQSIQTGSDPSKYPPARTGMRGSHDGSWEVAHALRDGQHWDHPTPDSNVSTGSNKGPGWRIYRH